MKIEIEEAGDLATVRVSGCLDTAAAADFAAAVSRIGAGVARVRFEFGAVEFIASSALRVMVALGKRLRGVRIEVAGANEVVRDVFEMTGLAEVFALV